MTALPRPGSGGATPADSNASDIIQRAPSTASSQCPTCPSSMTIGSYVTSAPRCSRYQSIAALESATQM